MNSNVNERRTIRLSTKIDKHEKRKKKWNYSSL